MFAIFGQYLRLPRVVKVVALGRILNSMGSFVVILATPLLTQHLGLSAAAAGGWLFAAQAAFLAGALAAGWAIDHFSKVRVLAVTLLVNAVAFSVGSISTQVVVVGVSLIVGYFFHGAWRPAMIAIAADETPDKDHAVAFSLMYFVHNIGFLIAPVAAGFLFAWDPRSVFAADAGSSVASAVVVLVGTGTALRAIRGQRRAGAPGTPTGAAGEERAPSAPGHDNADTTTAAATDTRGFLATALRDRPLIVFSLAFVLTQFTYSQVSFALPLTAIDRLGAAGTAVYGWIMAVNAAIVIVIAPPLTALTRDWQPVKAINLSALLYLLGFGMLTMIRSIPLMMASAFIWTTGEVLGAIHINVFVTRRAPRHLRGRYLSGLRTIFALGMILAPAIGGLIVEAHSVSAVWMVTSVLCAIASLAFFSVSRWISREHGDAAPSHAAV